VVHSRFLNHLLDVYPIKLVLGKVFSFLFLGLSELEEKHTDQEIDKKEGTD
jgi:hypothetical protein